MANLLQLVQQATGEMGLAVPTQVAGNTSTDVIQLNYLINAAGYELSREFPWEALNREYRFYTQYQQSYGVVTAGSATITGVDAAVVTALNAAGATNWMITGTGINQDTYILTATGTTVTVSQLPTASGTVQLTFGQTKYGGPCPNAGTHRYVYTVYALDIKLDLKEGSTKADLDKALQGHILAQGQLLGTYARTK